MSKTAENRRTLGMRKLSLLHRMKQIAMICFAVLFSVFSISAEATDPDISVNDTGTGMCIYDVLDTYSGTAGLKARWEANEIDLYWYSDDTQITNVSNSANSCSYAGGLTVPASPTKTGYTFNGWKVRGLPDGYTRLEYIQSSGTQYIDTGYKLSSADEVKIKAKFVDFPDAPRSSYIFGTYGDNANFGINNNGVNAYAVWGSSSTRFTPAMVSGAIYDIDMKLGLLTINEIAASYTPSGTFTNTTKNAYLFWANGTTQPKQPVAIYSFQIINNSTLVRDFIPAKNSSNVVGMWDTVSGTFKTNAGSGTFTAGPVVN